MLKNKKKFQSGIINWYKNNGRVYHWRESQDPFKILVAEVTLKLTGAWKAEKVYFNLIKHYSTPDAMSKAKVIKLRKLFKPLGLFHRCQLLVDMAKEINCRFGGKVPQRYDDLISIKGIGQYTANAILCLAYNKRVPLVDGSVLRIFRRCFNYKSDKQAYADKKLWEIAWKLLPDKDYKEYNLGLLDLGSVICKYRNPNHEECPVRQICLCV